MPTIGNPAIRRAEDLLRERRIRAECTFRTYFPEEGPLRRSLYPRSMLFFAAGKMHAERLFLAANRTSKTVSAGFEVTAHMTGLYPTWWVGRRFEGSGEWWAAGDTVESTRNVIQTELLGPRESVRAGEYRGMIPPHLIVDRTLRSGSVADAVETIWVKHVDRHHGAPMHSALEFKAYKQGRISFQGTSKRGIWLDEEPPDVTETDTHGGAPSGNGDIYTECLLRTATTQGIVIATFTPLKGYTQFIADYLKTAFMCDAEGTVRNAQTLLMGEAV